MTTDEILKLAAQCQGSNWLNQDEQETFLAFAQAVRSVALEEAAKVCDSFERANLYGKKECAAAIRALKEGEK